MKSASLFLLPALLFASCSRKEPLVSAVARIGNEAGRDEDRLARIVVERVPGTEGTYVAVRDWQYKWWGDFVCFEYLDGRVQWIAGGDVAPSEQSIHSARGVSLPGFDRPFVEVIGNTHMGHGNLYLYALEGRSLRLVLETFALDRHRDGTRIRGPHLEPRYGDLNGDGVSDVELTGVVEERDGHEGDAAPDRAYRCRKVFHWSPRRRAFVEDPAARRGLGRYQGRP